MDLRKIPDRRGQMTIYSISDAIQLKIYLKKVVGRASNNSPKLLNKFLSRLHNLGVENEDGVTDCHILRILSLGKDARSLHDVVFRRD